ncbi:hypothetical protein D7Y11_11300 [Corallococcus sp. AB018]|uniref:hypothetical protein n=1 Tax=unclassified Corallococcus TaxID=2685029 RepID=UPI000F88F1A6|nr:MULTISPECIES: hypothetical protein [unclassified Corallococcus]RUO93067.1 hypothetical protein D7Y11_11300 [Corallococcus sp. AB018]
MAHAGDPAADGAHLRLSAVERRRNKISDRGPNGPRRRKKAKEYDTLFLDVRLRVKAKRHPDLAALALKRAQHAVRLPPGASNRPASDVPGRLKTGPDRARRAPRGVSCSGTGLEG